MSTRSRSGVGTQFRDAPASPMCESTSYFVRLIAETGKKLMPPTIIILDDEPDRIKEMARCVQSRFSESQLIYFDNAPDMICWLSDHLEDAHIICLDHDLGPNRKRDGAVFDPGTGRDVADYLATRTPICPILIHTSNSMAAPGMEMVLNDAGWVHSRSYPEDDLHWINDYWINDVVAALSMNNKTPRD